MRRAFWRVVHLLPWSVTRHVCDLCAEFGFDPSKGLPAGREVRLTERPTAGWTCSHMTVTGTGLLGRPTAYCGCVMQPVTANR